MRAVNVSKAVAREITLTGLDPMPAIKAERMPVTSTDWDLPLPKMENTPELVAELDLTCLALAELPSIRLTNC